MSTYVHSGNDAYAGFQEDGFERVYGLFQEFSRDLYIESLILCAKAFSLNKAIEGFSQVVNFLEDAPLQIYARTHQTK
jgi:hypothetical protein